jgi:hypothetical protein
MAIQQPELFYERPGLPRLDRYERLDTLARVEGFLPVSQEEQTEVMGLLSVIDKPGGAAKHLAEVTIQQKKAGVDDPAKAASKITRDYIGYAQNAKDSVFALESLTDALTDVNPELILDRVVEPQEPGLLEFLRYFDLSLLKDTHDIRKVGYDPQKVDYSKNNSGIMFYLEEALTTWRVHQVRKRLPDALSDQSARFLFFAHRLVEVRDHSSPQLRAIAREGIGKLYQPIPVE